MEEQLFMHCKDGELSFNWISTDAQLREAASSWGSLSVMGLDTEFQRTSTFYPIPALYQVSAGGNLFLIDPLTISDWSPFIACLNDPNIIKVMHACMEDLELISCHLNIVPNSIFDTQLANAFQQPDYSISYARLVNDVHQIELAKGETRSDWLQRPLTDKQIKYALEDVLYLESLYDVLSARLQSLGRDSWFVDMMLRRATYLPNNPDTYYKKHKKAWTLEQPELRRLKLLTSWREKMAMKENVPRKRIVWDQHLFELTKVERLQEEHIVEILPKGIAARYGSQLIKVHGEGVVSEEFIEPLSAPLTRPEAKISKLLRISAIDQAESLSLAKELLARKQDAEDCIRYFKMFKGLPEDYLGWRYSIVGEDFLKILRANL